MLRSPVSPAARGGLSLSIVSSENGLIADGRDAGHQRPLVEIGGDDNDRDIARAPALREPLTQAIGGHRRQRRFGHDHARRRRDDLA